MSEILDELVEYGVFGLNLILLFDLKIFWIFKNYIMI